MFSQYCVVYLHSYCTFWATFALFWHLAAQFLFNFPIILIIKFVYANSSKWGSTNLSIITLKYRFLASHLATPKITFLSVWGGQDVVSYSHITITRSDNISREILCSNEWNRKVKEGGKLKSNRVQDSTSCFFFYSLRIIHLHFWQMLISHKVAKFGGKIIHEYTTSIVDEINFHNFWITRYSLSWILNCAPDSGIQRTNKTKTGCADKSLWKLLAEADYEFIRLVENFCRLNTMQTKTDCTALYINEQLKLA